MYVLSLIAGKFCQTEKDLFDFFSKTFFAHQMGNLEDLQEKTFQILKTLTQWKFILKKGKKFKATKIGHRVAELYIDPLTAHLFIQSLNKARKRKIDIFSFLQVISSTLEMQPPLPLRKKESEDLNQQIAQRERFLLQKAPSIWELEYEDFLKSIKLALMFESWLEEATESQI